MNQKYLNSGNSLKTVQVFFPNVLIFFYLAKCSCEADNDKKHLNVSIDLDDLCGSTKLIKANST